ncbi:MAG TPA: TPM domain-containing protein [Flavihumibacter sp.]|nr:TPM domain-containing protein [Bacteroidota bacterium]HOA38997.1 TPM domain-containing protein [Flavihumibacter sp.]HPZ88523.1 TPM domain-containing protein [Flavihumibacter sp.]HQD08580.1 TPM domain-containing protein [Flavihumibacter sp.]
MGFLSFGKKQNFLTHDETARIVQSIRDAEKKTSGEVRVYVESRCKYLNAVDRAAEIFWQLQMDRTLHRNGILVYVASLDHQAAIWGDDGIHQKTGELFWKEEVDKLLALFRGNAYADGIRLVVDDLGETLHQYFPYEAKTDKNELPDDIVFGD